MEAGQELDVLVAQEVLCITVYQATYAGYEVLIGKINPQYELYISTDHGWSELPAYSTDIGAAWQVAEYLQRTRDADEHYRKEAFVENVRKRGMGDLVRWRGEHAAHIICDAALKACGVEV